MYCASDVVTQLLVERHELDTVRAGRYCVFGVVNGFGCHFWYAWIASVAALGSAALASAGAPFPREAIEVAEQVAGDATLLSPIWCFTYLVVMSLLEGINPEGVKDRVRVSRERAGEMRGAWGARCGPPFRLLGLKTPALPPAPPPPRPLRSRSCCP